jgi:glutathione S-transferase
MPTLYHRAPVGHCAKVLITLAEKGIAYDSCLVTVPWSEQRPLGIDEIDPTWSLPILVDDDGTMLAESSVIDEYLDETRPQPPLMPTDRTGRWRARVWFKFVNEDLAPAVSMMAWTSWTRPSLDEPTLAALSARAESLAAPERRRYWRQALDGFTPEQLAAAETKIRGVVELAGQRLRESPWLAGADYSLADIDAWPFFEPLPRLVPHIAGQNAAPLIAGWIARVGARTAVATAVAGARDTDWVPGPEPIRWG